MGYSSIAFSIWVPCLVQAELSAHLPTSYSVVLILVATQEMHHGTYVVSYEVGYNTPELHQTNEVLPFQKVFLFIQNILEK